jgi:hypothetical protein
MDRYEYNEFKQEIRLEIAAERKLTYEKRLNEYKEILEPYKNLEIIYGNDEYNYLLDEMKKKYLCSESDNLRIGLQLNGIKFKSRWSKITIL